MFSLHFGKLSNSGIRMAILLIGLAEMTAIRAAKDKARQHPLTLDHVRAGAVAPGKSTLTLADRKPGWTRKHRPVEVLIPFGYRAAISVEEQPAGLCWHLSISVERKDPTRMPSVEAVNTIAEAFGIDTSKPDDVMMWTEEYEPGRHAVNIVTLYAPRPEGHA